MGGKKGRRGEGGREITQPTAAQEGFPGLCWKKGRPELDRRGSEEDAQAEAASAFARGQEDQSPLGSRWPCLAWERGGKRSEMRLQRQWGPTAGLLERGQGWRAAPPQTSLPARTRNYRSLGRVQPGHGPALGTGVAWRGWLWPPSWHRLAVHTPASDPNFTTLLHFSSGFSTKNEGSKGFGLFCYFING